MLHDFLTTNRPQLIERCRRRVALRGRPPPTEIEIEHGIPIFVDQLIDTLAGKQEKAAGARVLAMADDAARYGDELLQHGFTIEQVVHDYGDLCQAIMELSIETGTKVELDEFRVLNESLDDAIAEAVTAYAAGRALLLFEAERRAETQRHGIFVHEMRNHLQTATLARSALLAGNMATSGATGAVLDRSLAGMNDLIDRSIAVVREDQHHRRFAVAPFIAELRASAVLSAGDRKCGLSVPTVAPELAVDGDRALLMGAVTNLLHNAFKFSRSPCAVDLHAFAQGDRILIEVRDSCGGLPAAAADSLFDPFHQAGEDRSGLGLGLGVARRAVEADGGRLSVRDEAPVGCVFTIDLPRHAIPA